MANNEMLDILNSGPPLWNEWKRQHPELKHQLHDHMGTIYSIDLTGADLRKKFLWEADLSGVDLTDAKLDGAILSKADLKHASLRGAYLRKALLGGADLFAANLGEAKLSEASLSYANLQYANLRDADLSGADLEGCVLNGSNLIGATIIGCRVHGASVWEVRLDNAKQQNLIITRNSQPTITVDNIEVAQFIYLLLNNAKVRDAIDTVTSKAVLILGRFTPERKMILDMLREQLRKSNYLPVLFDFDKPASKDLTGTVSTLANMARFIIADLTDPSSIPHELATVIPNTVVPVQPVLQAGESEFAMFADFTRRYPWVLATHHYTSPEQLIADLGERVIGPAEAKVRELRGVKP